MHITSINRTLKLAGFAPAGKINHTCCGLPPLLELCVATLGKLNWGKTACAVLVLCAATAIGLSAQTLTTLFSFDGADGSNPVAGLVQATNGDLYGTTLQGGAGGQGVVFKIAPGGTLATLYSFCSQSGCADGEGPYGGLVQSTNGDFYGTTQGGGANGNYGTIFKITPSGALTTLHSFCSQSGCADGEYPYGSLVQSTNGDLYGTTVGGGTNAGGTFFRINPGGALTTLYSFCSQGGATCTDGSAPVGGLVQAANGDFYGVTDYGGNETRPRHSLQDHSDWRADDAAQVLLSGWFPLQRRLRRRGAGPGHQWRFVRNNFRWREPDPSWDRFQNHSGRRVHDAIQLLLPSRMHGRQPALRGAGSGHRWEPLRDDF